MENEKVRSISEAYSMQPKHLEVCTDPDHYYDRPTAIKEIKIEYDKAVQLDYYVGYNYEGQMLFRYLRDSVNVHYFPQSKTTTE